MAQIITFNNVAYTVPSTGDVSWGTNVSNYLVAIAAGALQLSGGAFPLTADATFGSSFGLQAQYYKSNTANIAASGNLRLASTDSVAFRNNANAADVLLAKNASDQLTWNGSVIQQTAIAAGTGITVTGGNTVALTIPVPITSGGTNNAAGLAGNRFVISTASAIGEAAAVTASRAVVSDGSGLPTASATTSTEIGYVSGVTSALQTQLGTKYAVAGGALTGNLSFTTTSTQGVVGSTTNDSAAAGNVGEYKSVVSSTLTNIPASGTWGDVTSLSLTAGDWHVVGSIDLSLNGATISGQIYGGISTTTGNSGAGLAQGSNQRFISAPTASSGSSVSVVFRFSLASTTTVYLKILGSGYATATPQAAGSLQAWRVR